MKLFIFSIFVSCLISERYTLLMIILLYTLISISVYFISLKYNKNIGQPYLMQPSDHAVKWPLILCCITPLFINYVISSIAATIYCGISYLCVKVKKYLSL